MEPPEMTTGIQPPRQAPRLREQLRGMFGDVADDAVFDRRCIHEPMGCGKPFAGLCRAQHGKMRRGCTLAEGHDGAHTDADRDAGSQVVYDAFRDHLSFREWLVTGMCQACQDTFAEECKRAEEAEALL